MNKTTVVSFNVAYSKEASQDEKQFVNELLSVWGKVEPAVAKNPSLMRKGIVFGMNLQKAIAEGVVTMPTPRAKPMRENG